MFLEKSSKFKSFLENLGGKLNNEIAQRIKLEEKLSKNNGKAHENLDQKLKIYSRLPKHSHNISMISSVKSDLGKEINDIRDDSILKEIPC